MKIVRTFPNGYIEVVLNDGWDYLREKGDFIEVEGKDYKIIDITTFENEPLYQCRSVV